ncbi:class D sortase [Cohnella hongkongensis]|uniref:Class D sortase n=1 Tax=Cohnella hongkongensis TaxID=178337 RepID=A0ABV9FB08_9BACL
MKKIAYALIAAGLILVAFPFVREYVDDREQKRLLSEMERSLSTVDPTRSYALQQEFVQLSEVLDRGIEGPVESNAPDEESVPMDDKTIAIIQIDKIDLKLPILAGATQKNMKVGAAHMTETAPLGEVGNAAVAAHRARTKGRMFNRLDEMEIGDRIDIRLRDRSIAYRVTDIKVVVPTDLSVLNADGNKAILTLITCDPLVNPTHRLIVHAELIEEDA